MPRHPRKLSIATPVTGRLRRLDPQLLRPIADIRRQPFLVGSAMGGHRARPSCLPTKTRKLLSDLDDDLALGTSCFDVSQSLIGRFKWKDPIDNRADRSGFDEGPEDYGTHSLRRTKASIIYKATGNLRAIQILLGHTKIENTVRYLGVDIEDALELAEHTEI
jgi:integrase